MPDISPRLGLAKPTDADPFSTEQVAANWQLLDNSPGIRIADNRADVTGWGSAHEGMIVYEKTSDTYWRWTGTTWVRAWANGWLNGAVRTTPISTTSSSTLAVVVSVVVTVPPGNRKLMINANWDEAESTSGRLVLAIWRNSTQLTSWAEEGDTDIIKEGAGGGHTVFDTPGLTSVTYSLRFRNTVLSAGTATVQADSDSLCTIDVVEV